jgi:hypothetical protein
MALEPSTGVVSLVGVFQARRFRNFPSPVQGFTVYTTLYDGVGEGTMELAVSHLETEKDVGSYKRWFTLPGRGRVFNLVLELKRCVFPAAGRYGVALRFGGKEITSRYLDIFTEE